MMTKFKLFLSLASVLLILSFFIWVYSLTESLEKERQKRVKAEDKAEIAFIERDVALAISDEQSLYAQNKQEQALELEKLLSEIKEFQGDDENCQPAIIHSSIERLWK